MKSADRDISALYIYSIQGRISVTIMTILNSLLSFNRGNSCTFVFL